jgi:hypothetical protein
MNPAWCLGRFIAYFWHFMGSQEPFGPTKLSQALHIALGKGETQGEPWGLTKV